MTAIESIGMGMAEGQLMPPTRPMIDGDFEGKSIISIDQFTREDIERVIALAGVMQEAIDSEDRQFPLFLGRKIVKAVMFEKSSRTVESYLTAADHLGAITRPVNLENSSMAKGETALETARFFLGTADATLVRHEDEGFMDDLAVISGKTFTNGGNGVADHPTQTLKDLYTMQQHYGHIDGLRVTLIGDVAMNRPARSLLRGLSRFKEIDLTVAAPTFAPMPTEVLEQVRASGTPVKEIEDLRPALEEPGVFVLHRPRAEYYAKTNPAGLKRMNEAYQEFGYNITPEGMSKAHPQADIFHPKPFKDEIDLRFHGDPRAVYHEQEDNGVAVHMAMLALQLAQQKVEGAQHSGAFPRTRRRSVVHAI